MVHNDTGGPGGLTQVLNNAIAGNSALNDSQPRLIARPRTRKGTAARETNGDEEEQDSSE